MSRLAAAIDVATEYAVHLHEKDGVPKDQAIAIGAAAVVRAARGNPSKFVTQRKVKDAGVGFDASTVMGVGSVISAVGFISKLDTGG